MNRERDAGGEWRLAGRRIELANSFSGRPDRHRWRAEFCGIGVSLPWPNRLGVVRSLSCCVSRRLFDSCFVLSEIPTLRAWQ